MTRRCAFALVALLLFCPKAVLAQLGKPAPKTTYQIGSLQGLKSETHVAKGYSYVQFSSDELVVKQFVNPTTNVVFGVTWKGKRRPSLTNLLGMDPSKITGPGVNRSLHVAKIRANNLSVDAVGLMGRYSGSAIRTDLLPNGVSASVVTP